MKQLVLVFTMLFVALFFSTSCQKDDLEGAEGTGGEAGESGQLWSKDSTANEIVNGVNLILTYDATGQSFKGTLENLNTKIVPQVRVEVHVYDAAGNSTEFGPTTPVDMQPGEKRNVTLPTPAAGNFVTFAMHPEVGGSTSGEGGNEGGGENHGSEGGNG